MSGWSARILRAASMPSVVFDGGIRMSVRTTSGLSSSTAVISSSNELAVPISSTSSVAWSSAEVPSRTR